MSNIKLETKINVNKSFIDELITSGWQEIENLQKQIAAIDSNSNEGIFVVELLNKLLTSYYVFTGNLENLYDAGVTMNTNIVNTVGELKDAPREEPIEDTELLDLPTETAAVSNDFEPFEYFVDFDEPVGSPLSDEDLYGKNN